MKRAGILLLLMLCFSCGGGSTSPGFSSEMLSEADLKGQDSGRDAVTDLIHDKGFADGASVDGTPADGGVLDSGELPLDLAGPDAEGDTAVGADADVLGPEIAADTVCQPQCPPLTCGEDDGCGGACLCPNGYSCTLQEPFICIPDCALLCAGRLCGKIGVQQECWCGPCEDNDPCTENICDESGSCSYPFADLPCDDGDPCTGGDRCSEGHCAGMQLDLAALKEAKCLCATDTECLRFEDQNVCNGKLVCMEAGGLKVCGVDPATVPDCDDHNLCTKDTCTGTGGCLHEALDVACSDNNPCTVGDWCSGGQCLPGKEARDCDDGETCTDDLCDPKLPTGCVNKPNTLACDDGNPCTLGDRCVNGACMSGSLWRDCNDNNPCTVDSCDSKVTGGCVHKNSSDPCDDGDPCTMGDYCAEGACKAGSQPKSCDDNNVCTADTCVAGTGCRYTPSAGACNDGSACTFNDYCADKVCKGTPYACNGASQCEQTPGTCDGKGGCTYTPKTGAACNDGNPCTKEDKCGADKTCVGTAYTCTAGNQCQTNPGTCDGLGGCTYAPKNGTACDDGNPCTVGDTCLAGACAGGAGVRDCNDNNVCTEDLCDKAKPGGCWYKPRTGACVDKDACTLNDYCEAGVCKPGPGVLTCNDNNVCTTDSCNPASGCVYAPVGGGCTDGDSCTSNDYCEAGLCKPGTDICACTTNAECAKLDDGNWCNGGYSCVVSGGKGRCQFDGKVVTCNMPPVPACQVNACRPADGICVVSSVNEGGSCDDGNACTLQDTCKAGQCAGRKCEDLGQFCYGGKCVACLPKCDGKQCGADGCGGTCGTCSTGQYCDEAKSLCVTEGMVLVPQGSFWMGCNQVKDSSCDPDEFPYHEVILSNYEVDRTEVTQSAFAACVAAKACVAPSCSTYRPVQWPKRPVGCLSWYQANNYCAYAGKRLCSDAEWEKASRGTDGRLFPWGDAVVSCAYAVMYDGTTDGCGTGWAWDVCSKPAGNSPYGLCDMAGNVWEWANDWYGRSYYCLGPAATNTACANGAAPYQVPWNDPPGPPTGATGEKSIKGASYYFQTVKYFRSSYREAGAPGTSYADVGVRCCKSR